MIRKINLILHSETYANQFIIGFTKRSNIFDFLRHLNFIVQCPCSRNGQKLFRLCIDNANIFIRESSLAFRGHPSRTSSKKSRSLFPCQCGFNNRIPKEITIGVHIYKTTLPRVRRPSK